jgi:hypothetical protein
LINFHHERCELFSCGLSIRESARSRETTINNYNDFPITPKKQKLLNQRIMKIPVERTKPNKLMKLGSPVKYRIKKRSKEPVRLRETTVCHYDVFTRTSHEQHLVNQDCGCCTPIEKKLTRTSKYNVVSKVDLLPGTAEVVKL